MKGFVQGVDRQQTTLLPECLDDWVGETNPIRAVDVFVDALELRDLGFDGVDPAATGRPAVSKRCRARFNSSVSSRTTPSRASRHNAIIRADGYNLLAARPIGSAQQQTHAPQQISFDGPSTKVLRKEYSTSPRRIARYLAKNAPTQTLIEPRSLETNRVNNSSPAATTTCLLLGHCHHAGPNPGATECLGQIHEVDGQKSKRSPTTDPADDLAIFRSSNDDMQRHAITIAHDRIIKSVKTVTDDLSNLGFRRVR
jgi:hypothetical protein